MEKVISIIIPCYNVENYIDRCFESLKNQTIGIDNMELIFVNDASTDKTLEHLMRYEKQYPESVMVINFSENQRQGTARNVALEYASAPYIGYVDSDDWVECDMFEKMIQTLERNDCDFVQCQWDYARSKEKRQQTKCFGKTGLYDLTSQDVRKEFIRSKVALVSPWDKVFKKEFLIRNHIYFPEKIRNEDIFFVYLCFVYAKSYYYMDEVLYHYFVNETGTMRQKKAAHQFEKMTVSYGFLQECKKRGLWVDKPMTEEDRNQNEAIEWMFLERYYVYMLWECFEQFPQMAYEKYLEMKALIKEDVPSYKTNSYRFLEGNEFDNLMLKLLDYNMNEADFEIIRKQMLNKMNAKDAQEF